MQLTEIEEARFWAHVRVGPGCWEWTGERTEKGYGRLKLRGKWVRTHRLAWILERGSPGEALICHRCDNPSCCRPGHLFLGTPAENTQDSISKGRQPQAKLEAGEVREIRRLWEEEGISQTELAAKYGVSKVMIHYIVTGKSWRHLLDPDKEHDGEAN